MVLEKTLESPWTAGRTNQPILKEISPEYSLEGLMLKLKLQYFGHLKRRTDSLEKTLILGKIESRRRRSPLGCGSTWGLSPSLRPYSPSVSSAPCSPHADIEHLLKSSPLQPKSRISQMGTMTLSLLSQMWPPARGFTRRASRHSLSPAPPSPS